MGKNQEGEILMNEDFNHPASCAKGAAAVLDAARADGRLNAADRAQARVPCSKAPTGSSRLFVLVLGLLRCGLLPGEQLSSDDQRLLCRIGYALEQRELERADCASRAWDLAQKVIFEQAMVAVKAVAGVYAAFQAYRELIQPNVVPKRGLWGIWAYLGYTETLPPRIRTMGTVSVLVVVMNAMVTAATPALATTTNSVLGAVIALLQVHVRTGIGPVDQAVSVAQRATRAALEAITGDTLKPDRHLLQLSSALARYCPGDPPRP